MRWLDLFHAHVRNGGRFFPQGWGDPKILARSLVQRELPPAADFRLIEEQNCDYLDQIFSFPSPTPLPAEAQTAYCRLMLPRGWNRDTPVCVHLAATGDQGFENRARLLALPLLEGGIGSLILENPLYGKRRPGDQDSTYIRSMSDLWSMGLATVAETRTMLAWLDGQGFRRLGICGVSMGGQMATQAAALHPEPLAVCACIAPHSAETVFTEGVLSNFVDLEALECQTRMAEQLRGTDLRLFPRPVRPECCIWVGARFDAYVLPHSTLTAHAHWPGSQLRWVPSGHVGSVLFHRRAFLQGIKDAFALLSRRQFYTDW